VVAAVALWYVATQAGAGRLSLGDVALYLSAIAQAESRLALLTSSFTGAGETLRHLRTFFAFLDAAGPSIALPPVGQGTACPPTWRTGIALRQVAFRYPEAPAAVLEDVTASLPAGQVTALVGANGAGKSTLVKLLTRMYDPIGGEILLDGAPLAAYDLEALRRRIAVVYQDVARFSLPLRANIAVGLAAAGVAGSAEPAEAAQATEVRDDQIEAAARLAGADEVAARLPQGYRTEVTRRFAGGVELSGGEWQKVALARAFIRDAAFLILDEPTAALDADAEERLFARFRELVAGKTALLISHRFSTVRMADHILVLEDGRVVEAGSHDALVALGGRYAALYEMQAGRYREP
jgi:ATP-binding cassette subfamily B protein